MFLECVINWWNSRHSDRSDELTVENCELDEDNIMLGRFSLSALGLLDYSDYLSFGDIVLMCYAVGTNSPEYIIEGRLRSLGLSNRSIYTFGHFLHLWRELLSGQEDEDLILERAFCFFDKDGNGAISTAEFKATISELSDPLSEQELNNFLSTMDTDSDGSIDYGEFIKLLKCQKPAYIETARKSQVYKRASRVVAERSSVALADSP